MNAAGRPLRPQLALLWRLSPDGALLESGRLLGRLFRDGGSGTSYVVLVNRDAGSRRNASSAILPASIDDEVTLTDVFTNRTFTRGTIGDLELGAGVGTLLRVGS